MNFCGPSADTRAATPAPMSPITAATASAKKRVRLRSATRPPRRAPVVAPGRGGAAGRRGGGPGPGGGRGPWGAAGHPGAAPARGAGAEGAGGGGPRGGRRHYGFELRPQARLFLDRPAGELLDFQKNDASEGRSRVRCFHLPRTNGVAILPFTHPLRLQSPT